VTLALNRCTIPVAPRDRFLAKLEELIDRSADKIRADIVSE